MTDRPPLRAGAILSYSSGSTQRDPYGFRIAKTGGNLLAAIEGRWPHLVASFRGRVPVVLNTYPAFIGTFDFGIYVDSYLSYSTASRALSLAHLEQLPLMLLGQPLFIAELLHRHLDQGRPLPDAIFFGMGGYPTPQSLERALAELSHENGAAPSFFYGYGVAEVDAACLLSCRRNGRGENIYVPRGPDVEVTLDGVDLLLSLKGPDGDLALREFPTGDCGREEEDGYVLWNDERLHHEVAALLEAWRPDDWRRRTGYLHYGRVFRVQLRKGLEPRFPFEAEFYEYARKYGHNWLFKPQWQRVGGTSIHRRTLI